MTTPRALLAVLADESPPAGLSQAVQALSDRYRDGITTHTQAMRTELERAAYVAARMPATSAAVNKCLSMIPAISFSSVLDLGSGPGSALWAINESYPNIQTITALERDRDLITLGKRLAQAGPTALQQATWISADLNALPTLQHHDLVSASYVTNELSDTDRITLINQAWDLCRVGVLIIEPGTPRGFSAIIQLRAELLRRGAYIAAPCSHQKTCPLVSATLVSASERWCHFRVRVPRSRHHRMAKGGSLGYEDEPFSFIYAQRQALVTHHARILSTPVVDKGSVTLSLCREQHLQSERIARRDKMLYKKAANCAWGDTWPIEL